MINFLHTFEPQAELFSIGFLTVYWYGFFMVLAILAALAIALKLASRYGIKKDLIFDLGFWLIIWGIIGARIYDIFLELPYYLSNPWQTIKIWQGGLAIHGAIIAGIIVIIYFAKKNKINFWKLGTIITPSLALGQSIGRFGNYFNQELFGLPTKLPWGIPINLFKRPIDYISSPYFHPTFLYESLGSLIIFIILMSANLYLLKKKQVKDIFFVFTTLLYVILYSVLRFGLEFIRIDRTPLFLGLRFPQIISLTAIVVSIIILIFKLNVRNKNKK